MNAVQVHHFTPGMDVWASRAHGLLRRVKRHDYGTVESVRDDGRVVVDWWRTRTTTAVPPAHLAVGPEIHPGYASIIERALTTVDPKPGSFDDDPALSRSRILRGEAFPDGPPNPSHPAQYTAGWNDGWASCMQAVREQLEYEGLIPATDNEPWTGTSADYEKP